MGFEKRSEATKYKAQDDDTLEKIAERETAGGNPVTAADIAKFNWGTDDPNMVDEHLRDELGCCKRGEDKRFVISSDAETRSDLLIPKRFKKSALDVDRSVTLRVKKKAEPPPQFEACAQVRGICFEFDKSFVRSLVVDDLKKVEEALSKKPDAKIIIFGHTDSVGSDAYNKALAERRALSVYAFITNDADIWENELYNHPREQWGLSVVQEILADLGHDPGPIDGIMGPKTRSAIQSFNPAYNNNTSSFRRELFLAYMTGKHDVELSPDQFLKPRHMGCGEFNRIDLVDGDHEPNRRVTFFLFNPERPPNFPCKYEDTQPCIRQFAPATRENPPPPPPRHKDSFWCSFYDSIARACPAEGGIVPVIDRLLELVEANAGEKQWALAATDDTRRLKVDHHFAPRAETVSIHYNIKGLTASKVTLEVRSERLGADPILSRELTVDEKADGNNKVLKWDGKANSGAELKDKFINPLYGPFKVKLVADSGEQTNEAKFFVLFHSIRLQMGSYTPDGNAPPEADQIKWVKYKLNELGYFAGPVNGNKDDQTKRAIKRYKHDMPGMEENDDETETLFLNLLRANERKREIMSEPEFVTDATKNSHGFLDHDYFYFGTDGASGLGNFSSNTGHRDRDRDKLDRFELPLEAIPYLVSKSDLDGNSKDGKLSPEGTGEVEIEWSVIDPPADLSALPTPSADVPSHGQAFVRSALNATAGNAADATNPKDNCPTAQGGHRTDNKNYFHLGANLPPFISTSSGDRVFVKTYQHASDHVNKNGTAGILFRGTYLAGDDYIITAKLAFESQPNKEALEKMHENFTGRAFADLYQARTGRLTTYRRHHIAAMVDWPRPNYGVDMTKVADAYAVAHCLLDTNYPTRSIGDVLLTDADKKEYLDLCVAEHGGWSAADLSFDDQGMYPRKIPPQGKNQAAKDYKRQVRTLVQDFLTPGVGLSKYDFYMKFANMIREKTSRTRPPGSIVIRANFCKPVKVERKVPIPILGPLIELLLPAEEYIPSIHCIGLCAGVTVISNPMGEDEQERFLFAHEIGHNRYLTHHHTKGKGNSDNLNDHDSNDLNCTMCYPFGIQARPGLTWNRGDTTTPNFCGKCILKLRGWVVHTGLPASH